MKPLLTVCLLTYNHSKFIDKAIEGVLTQKVNFLFEIVIADDYSTDGARDILQNYKAKYPDKIKLILQQKNVGAVQNWIDLITYPTTKYIAYFEGDDYWIDEHKLQKQVDFLESNEDYSICYTNGYFIKENENFELVETNIVNNKNKPSNTINQTELLSKNCVLTLTVVFRNNNINIPNWIRKVLLVDWSFFILLSLNGKIMYLKDITAIYRMHNNGIFSMLGNKKQLIAYINSGEIIKKNLPTNLSKQMQAGQKNRVSELINIFKVEKDYKQFFKYFFKLGYLFSFKEKVIFLLRFIKTKLSFLY